MKSNIAGGCLEPKNTHLTLCVQRPVSVTEAPQQVHQSDLDGIKGLYLINAGDEVTQFLFVSASRSTTISTDRWGWGGYTTHDLHRCQLTARAVALAYNWWSLFVRAAHPEARLEAVTSRPLLLTGISEKTRHARQARLTITPVHGKGGKAKGLLTEVSALLHEWKRDSEQLKAKTVWESLCDYLIEALTGFN